MRALPPLNQLRAFEACARHLSFGRAAEEIGVTATAVSHQIRLLELYIGLHLFRRRPRPVALTEDGARLFPVVRDALDRMAAGVAELSVRKGASPLRVTTTNAFALRWLAPRLPLWRERHPGARIHVIGTDAIVPLAAGEADIAIRYCRRAPAGSDLLMRDRFHVVASPRLIGARRSRLKPDEILAFPLIEAGWPPGDLEAPTWARWMDRAKIPIHQRPEPALVFHEEAHAIDAVLSGQGVGICSDVLVGAELASGGLAVLSSVALPGLAFHVLYRGDSPKIDAIRAFVDWTKAMARQPPAAG